MREKPCMESQTVYSTHSIYIVVLIAFCYRVMHDSARCGLAIACRLSVHLSVRLSVTLVDHDHIG